jgi:hypothetical protein
MSSVYSGSTWKSPYFGRGDSFGPAALSQSALGVGGGAAQESRTESRVADLPFWKDPGPAAPCRSAAMLAPRGASEHALVADAARHAVGIEPLEQELRRPPRDPEQVAEAGERDRPRLSAFVHEHL